MSKRLVIIDFNIMISDMIEIKNHVSLLYDFETFKYGSECG
jgi:hypothetical protein